MSNLSNDNIVIEFITKGFAKASKAIVNLGKRVKGLSKTIGLLANRVKRLNLDKLIGEQFDGGVKSTEALTDSVSELSDVISEAREGLSGLGNDVKKASKDSEGAFKGAGDGADKSKKKVKGLSGVFSDFKKNLGKLAIAATITQIFLDATRTVSEFEVSLKSLGSITGLTGVELDDLGQRAIDLSLKYGTSATEILKGFQLIGSAKPELLASADALEEVTAQAEVLAKAAGLTLPEAGAALTKSLNQYGATAQEAAMFTDILATSQQKGTATISQLSESLKNVGSVAAASNLSFEQTNVLLQALAKGGLVGAEAGTQLRGVLIRLAATNRDELNPSTQGFNDILDVLSSEVTNVTEATEIFGAENAAAALTLIKQKQVVEDLTGALNEQGNALGQASNNTDTAKASVDRLLTSWDAFVLSVDKGSGPISTTFKTLTNEASLFVQALTALNDGRLGFSNFTRQGIQNLVIVDEKLKEIRGNISSIEELNAFISSDNVGRLEELFVGSGRAANDTEAQIQVDQFLQSIQQSLIDQEAAAAKAKEAQEEVAVGASKNNKAVEDASKAARGSIEQLSEQLADLQTQLDQAAPDDIALLSSLTEEIKDTEEEIEQLEALLESIRNPRAATSELAALPDTSLNATLDKIEELEEKLIGTTDLGDAGNIISQINELRDGINQVEAKSPFEIDSEAILKQNREAFEKILEQDEENLKRRLELRETFKENLLAIGGDVLNGLESQQQNRQESIDEEIVAQKEKIESLSDINSGASEESIAAEEERLKELEDQRRKSINNQRALAIAEIAINNASSIASAIKSITEAGPLAAGNAIQIGAAIAGIVAAISSAFGSLPAFRKGTEDTGEMPHQGRLAWIHRKERIVPEHINKFLLARNISNEDLINFGNPALSDSLVNVIGQPNAAPDFSELQEDMRDVRKAVEGIKMNVNLDSRGFNASIETYAKNQARKSRL